MKHHHLKGLWEMVEDPGAWRAAVHGLKKDFDSTEWLNNNDSLFLKGVEVTLVFTAGGSERGMPSS